MNKIRLNTVITTDDGRYMVYLDHDNRFIFDNKRKAEDYLRHVSRELELLCVFIADELIRVNEFSSQFLLAFKRLSDQRKLNATIAETYAGLDRILLQPHGENKQAFIVHDCSVVVNSLLACYDILLSLSQERLDMPTRNRIIVRRRVCELYIDNLDKLKVIPERQTVQVEPVTMRRVS